MNLVLSVLSLFLSFVNSRELWSEAWADVRDVHTSHAHISYPRVIDRLLDICPLQICGHLAEDAVAPLLSNESECAQQHFADTIINLSRQFDVAVQEEMIRIAKEYRQVEKNTPLDYSKDPPVRRNSVFCQTPPQNLELEGLVQAQDPGNELDLFFDPASQSTVRLGDQANTFPYSPYHLYPRDNAEDIATCQSQAVITVTVVGTSHVAIDTRTAYTISMSGSLSGTATIDGTDFPTSLSPSSAGSDSTVISTASVAESTALAGTAVGSSRASTSSSSSSSTLSDTFVPSESTLPTTATTSTSYSSMSSINQFTAIATTFLTTSSSSSTSTSTSTSSSSSSSTSSTSTTTSTSTSTSTSSSSSTSTSATATASSSSLQTYTGSLGGISAPAVSLVSTGVWAVEGETATFNSLDNALQRSCNDQYNSCADAANADDNSSMTVGDCGEQETECLDSYS